MNILYKEDKNIDKDNLVELYLDAGWSKYISNTEKMLRAFENSLLVISAWQGVELVGLIRSIGDGETILYIQDLLVKSCVKRKGIGKKLVEKTLNKFPNVRQKVLITDKDSEANIFYKKVGFKESEKLNIKAYVNFEI